MNIPTATEQFNAAPPKAKRAADFIDNFVTYGERVAGLAEALGLVGDTVDRLRQANPEARAFEALLEGLRTQAARIVDEAMEFAATREGWGDD